MMCVKNGGRLVIVNLQHTPLDKHASVRVYAKADDVMQQVMEQLNLAVPAFTLKRYLTIEEQPQKSTIDLYGFDPFDKSPITFLKKVELTIHGTEEDKTYKKSNPSFTCVSYLVFLTSNRNMILTI
jgi:hypothetical protein